MMIDNNIVIDDISSSFRDALLFYLEHIEDDPIFYLPYVSVCLNNLTLLYSSNQVLYDPSDFNFLYSKTMLVYNMLNNINSHNASAWLDLSYSFYRLNQFEYVITSLEKVIIVNLNDEQAWLLKSNALLNLQRFEESIESSNKAIYINPSNEQAWFAKGNALLKIGERKEAIYAYTEAIRINSKHIGARISLAKTHYDLDILEEALIYANDAIIIDDNNSLAHYWAGRICIERKAYDDALEHFEKAKLYDKGNAIYILAAANSKYLSAMHSKSTDQILTIDIQCYIKTINKLIILMEKDNNSQYIAYLYYDIAQLYAKTKNYEEAKAMLQKCLENNPEKVIQIDAKKYIERIMEHKIGANLWNWWMNYPIYRWTKRINFILLTSILGGLIIKYKYISSYIEQQGVFPMTTSIIIFIIVLILIYPLIKSFSLGDIKLDLCATKWLEPEICPMISEIRLSEKCFYIES